MICRVLLLAGALFLAPRASAAQDSVPVPDAPPVVEGWASNVTRVESWRFFDPPSPAVDPRYTFFGNRADMGLGVRGPRFDLSGAFSYVRVEHLPKDAIGPGGLGSGAFYFAASGLPYSYQVFLTDLTFAAHTADRRLTLTAGRMRHTSGAEGARPGGRPASAHLTDLRRLRLDGRLIGSFDWSYYQRRFDGVRADLTGARHYGGAGLFLVSQGGFEESANLTMSDLLIGTAYGGRRHGTDGESQVFAHLYRDRREVDIRPDNAGVPVRAADVSVVTAGGSHIAARRVGDGEIDWLAWGAVQGGDWYAQRHRAISGAIEAGYRWSSAWQPWLRAGASYASGDDAPRDDRHGTFFPMLQDTRTYGLSMTYAQMNLRDVFAQVFVEPHPRARLRLEMHRLDLAEGADRWYQGSGATASGGRFFGYSARPSFGSRRLGTTLEGTADVRLSRYWSINGYLGRMWGGPVVRGVFVGDRLTYWYVENVLRFKLPRS